MGFKDGEVQYDFVLESNKGNIPKLENAKIALGIPRTNAIYNIFIPFICYKEIATIG
jgi:hypothetical protein